MSKITVSVPVTVTVEINDEIGDTDALIAAILADPRAVARAAAKSIGYNRNTGNDAGWINDNNSFGVTDVTDAFDGKDDKIVVMRADKPYSPVVVAEIDSH